MTKDEIVKSLRACGRSCCDECVCFKEKMLCKVKNLEAADLIEQQEAKIKELEANVPRWIPCSERVPELPNGRRCNRAVIVCVRGHVMPLIYERSIVRGKTVERWKWTWDRIYDDPESITHWMPLPEPPDMDGGGEDG